MLKHINQMHDSFLYEEIKCDYKISIERKKIWSIELDLLAEFDRVCKKNGLSYYATAGTLLGAVRHKGFIPWDDDIDIMMMRDQYEKLCKIASKEFLNPYFFQTQYSDFGATYGHAKLRNSETTCVFSCDKKYRKTINQGIFLDVFPADNVIDDEALFNRQRRRADFFKRISDLLASSTREAYRWHPNFFVRNTRKFLMIFFGPLNYRLANYFWRKFDLECQRYNNVDTNCFSLLSFQFNKKWIQYRKDYNYKILAPFEYTTIPICENYDHALRSLYGDWHIMVKGESQHEGVIVDTEQSYKEYFNKKK